jgi:Na+-transporting NADH:ubiquinone oxidoreductase subunit C
VASPKRDPGTSGGPWLRRLRALPDDHPVKTLVVVLLVCLCASLLVTGSAVLLRPSQLANQERERQARLAEIIAQLPGGGAGPQVEARVVDLASGKYAEGIDPTDFDQREAVKDPAQSLALAPERDIAQITRRAHHAVVYLVHSGDRLDLVILPVYGRGFGSVLRGFLGLSGDTREVVGLVFGVAAGEVAPGSPEEAHQVDGLTGATWTGQGVTGLLRFWLGDDGFGPYLRNLRDRRGLR